MTWIRTIPSSQADQSLRSALTEMRKLYPPEYGTEAPAVRAAAPAATAQNITGSHTLIPEALYHAFSTYGALLSPDLPLSRRQHELIATVVSVLNECFY